MIDWVYAFLKGIVEHYKAMTALMLTLAILKMVLPAFFWILSKYQDRSHRKKLIKMWVEAGYGEEEATKYVDKMLLSDKKKPKPSLIKDVRKWIRNKTR
ncbi:MULTISPECIES: hypothetical protein [Klebsiella]|uniref:hypothetical protein n=1 Tax=Klebsiella TaxID=570 RepID=UPI0021E802A3|nr:hypothetical protein [Klebsiella oxytoca]